MFLLLKLSNTDKSINQILYLLLKIQIKYSEQFFSYITTLTSNIWDHDDVHFVLDQHA
jgi:hypothetical protein